MLRESPEYAVGHQTVRSISGTPRSYRLQREATYNVIDDDADFATEQLAWDGTGAELRPAEALGAQVPRAWARKDSV